MTDTRRPRPMRPLLLLRNRCAALFTKERTILVSHGPILISKKGSPLVGDFRLIPVPYDLDAKFESYLWGELRRIEWGIEARGYSEKELCQLESSLEQMEGTLASIPANFDRANYVTMQQMNLLN